MPARPGMPTAAVLTFQSNLKEPQDSGQMMADILSARLCAVAGLTVVSREDIEKILNEQKLTLAGLVGPEQAVKVGKLLGAQLLVTGRVTVAGSAVYVICKVISSETGQMKGFFLTLPQNVTFEQLLEKTGTKLAGSLGGWAGELIPPEKRGPDPVDVLKKLLAGKAAPPLAVVIPEQHIGRAVLDPAVETEFKRLLTGAGILPVDVKRSVGPEVLRHRREAEQLRPLLGPVRYLICGEAFSEHAGVVHGLTIGSARAEVEIIDLRTGKILLADRQTARSPDLSEHLAGKTALQKAGHEIAMRLLPKLFECFPAAPKPPPKAEDKP